MGERQDENPDWEKDLDRLRQDFVKSLDAAQKEIDKSFQKGRGMMDRDHVDRLLKEVDRRANEVRHMVKDYEGTSQRLLRDLQRSTKDAEQGFRQSVRRIKDKVQSSV